MATNVPVWRESPEPVWINCKEVFEDTPFKAVNEVIVQFVINNEEYTAFVLKKFINPHIPGLQAFIVAEHRGGLLVNMPTETLTSGPNILVPLEEVDKVLTKVERIPNSILNYALAACPSWGCQA